MKKLTALALLALIGGGVWGQTKKIALTETDNFTYDGETLHHYGVGFHKYLDVLDGNNLYGSGYFGIDLFTGGKHRFRIKHNGNVGIGTTTPDGKLHLRGGMAIQHPNMNYDSSGDAGERAGIIFGTNHPTHNSMFWISPDATQGNRLNIGVGNKYNDNATYLSIANSGKVGIGTTTPDAKLEVAGNIKAQEIEVTLASIDDMQLNGTLAANQITVTTNGQTADFVFEEDYELRDLQEVESFIQTNKHLPDIPSAAAMEENGVNLAEMNKLLLLKIEELTLYAIDKENRILELEAEGVKQKVEVERQKAEVDVMKSELAEIKELLLKR